VQSTRYPVDSSENQLQIQLSIEKGLEQGLEQEKVETAKRMLELGAEDTFILNVTHVTQEILAKIKQALPKKS